VRVAVVATALAAACSGPLALAGCRAGAAPPTRPASSSSDGGVANEASAGPTSDGLASTEALAARGATDAPLMRELLRVEHAAPRSPAVRADRDLCVRALYAAARPVRAWLADEAGLVRGEIATGASGAVPPRGPACVQKGESLHLVVESEGPVVARAVLFAAP